MSCIFASLWYFLLWLLPWCFKPNTLLYELWVRSATYPLFSLWHHWHLISSQISQSEISKCKLLWTFFYLQRRGLKFTSDSCETLSLDRLPSLCVCVYSHGCVYYIYCMYCMIVCVSCACLRGVGIHYESLKEVNLWNVEVRISLSGRVKASPLICPYATQEIWVEPLGRPKLD